MRPTRFILCRPRSFSYSRPASCVSRRGRSSGLVVVPGVSAHPTGGGTIAERPCREAMDKVRRFAPRRPARRCGLPALARGHVCRRHRAGGNRAGARGARRWSGRRCPSPAPSTCTATSRRGWRSSGDILVGLKTAPHTDGAQTAELAGRILLDTLAGKVRPVSYVLPIPMILQGEKAMTTAEPFRSLVEEARRLEREGVPGHEAKILAATLFVGCAWTDSPDTGMSVMVTADGSRAAARAAAIHLARRIWDARRQFAFGCETAELEEGVTRALEAKESTVFLTDSGDNVTASTPGDLPDRAAAPGRAQGQERGGGRHQRRGGHGDASRRARARSCGSRSARPSRSGSARRWRPKSKWCAWSRARARRSCASASVEVILADGPTAFTDPRQFEPCGIDPLSRKSWWSRRATSSRA